MYRRGERRVRIRKEEEREESKNKRKRIEKMAVPRPEFTVTLDVDKGSYGDLIASIRQHLTAYCTRYTHGRPILPREESPPRLWFFVVLTTASTKPAGLTLALRIDNLYLVGFRTPAGAWWEFGEQGTAHLIAGSQLLGFGEAYSDLIGHHKTQDSVTVGRTTMKDAVEALAKHTAAEGQDKAKIIVVLVIMVCEAARFLSVGTTVADLVHKKQEGHITKQEAAYLTEWGKKISKALITWDTNPEARFPELEKLGINKGNAADLVALVKNVAPDELV